MNIFDDIKGCIHKLAQNDAMAPLYHAMKFTSILDMSVVVLVAKDIIHKSYIRSNHYSLKFKMRDKSEQYRNEGNIAFSLKDFKRALECYNKALLYAPKNSQEEILAYSNRSAVLFKINAVQACLKDIATCLSLNCTQEITKKLVIREDECKKRLWYENLKNDFLKNSFTLDYFRLKSKHPQVANVSSEIDITMGARPRIIAAKDIKVGTVVALEKCFVSQTNEENLYTSCYFCQNMSLNLMPCDGCCYALFCSDECKQQCYSEYHQTECIYDVNILGIPDLEIKLMLKTVLKMKNLCKSWEVFDKKTQLFYTDIKNQSIHDIFDVNSEISVMNYDMSVDFIYGKIFNTSLKCAFIITELCKIPFFFPTTSEARNSAIRSFARVMMHLIVFPSRIIQIYNSAEDVLNGTITTSPECNYGWLSFTSKLKHSCDANLMVLGVNNNVALVTTENIKAGTELTISYIGHWYEAQVENKPLVLYRYIQTVCSCRICKEKWVGDGDTKKGILNDNQRSCYRKWKLSRTKESIVGTDEKLFRQTCNTLNMLRDVINTEEYHDVYSVFRSSLSLYQAVASGNMII